MNIVCRPDWHDTFARQDVPLGSLRDLRAAMVRVRGALDAAVEHKFATGLGVLPAEAQTPRNTAVFLREIDADRYDLHRSTARGAGEIVLTSWDRDGTGAGYDLELLRAVSEAVEVPVVASGGAAHPDHLAAALAAGADAVLAASIFHDARFTVGQVKDHLAALGHPMRRTEPSL